MVTPLTVDVLIHCDGSSDPVPRRDMPAVRDTVRWLMYQELIRPTLPDVGCYRTTARGVAWLQAMLATPVPVQRWVVPASRPAEPTCVNCGTSLPFGHIVHPDCELPRVG